MYVYMLIIKMTLIAAPSLKTLARDALDFFGAYYKWMIYGINCCKNYTAYILFVLLGTCS